LWALRKLWPCINQNLNLIRNKLVFEVTEKNKPKTLLNHNANKTSEKWFAGFMTPGPKLDLR